MLRTKALILSGAALLALAVSTDRAAAQTMLDSLSLAYSNNPSLNAQRSKTRSTDEGVAIAMSGYRPQISASASVSSSAPADERRLFRAYARRCAQKRARRSSPRFTKCASLNRSPPYAIHAPAQR